MVPLPSLFFIGTNGQPIDIVTGVIESSRELIERIKKVADRAQVKLLNLNVTNTESNTPGPSVVTASASTSSSTSPTEDVVCDNGVCRKVTKETKTPEQTAAETKSLDEKVKIAKELLEKKKKDKENEEAKVVHRFKGVTERVLIFFNLAFKENGNGASTNGT